MRDAIFFLIIITGLPLALVRPYYGVLVYAWASYMYPQMLAWSFVQTIPIAKLAALASAAGAVLNGGLDYAPLRRPVSIVLILLWGCFTLSSSFAVYPDSAWGQWQDVSKLVIMGLFASTLITDRTRLKFFLLVIAGSLGFYGVKAGIFSIATGGTEMVWGPGTSVIAANNSIGLALNMCLPFLWYLASEEKGWKRLSLRAAFFLCIPAIMFTYSRASALTLGIVLVALILKGRNAIILFAILAIVALIAIPNIPEKWWDRQETTLTYEEDNSAMSRVENWKFLWRFSLERPLVGYGFRFQTREIFEKNAPEFLMRFRRAFNTHNIFLGILASHGFPALLLFLTMIGLIFLNCRKIRRSVRYRPDLKWLAIYCDMVQVSMLAFIMNGMFVNMEYFDLPYHLAAVTASMTVMCDRLVSQEQAEVQDAPEILPAAV